MSWDQSPPLLRLINDLLALRLRHDRVELLKKIDEVGSRVTTLGVSPEQFAKVKRQILDLQVPAVRTRKPVVSTAATGPLRRLAVKRATGSEF